MIDSVVWVVAYLAYSAAGFDDAKFSTGESFSLSVRVDPAATSHQVYYTPVFGMEEWKSKTRRYQSPSMS